MKKIINAIEIIVLYIVGYILFNIVFSTTEIIIAKILSFEMNFFQIFKINIFENLKLYSVIYIIIIFIYYGINIYLIKKLNKKLKRRKETEK